jgi:hypothetical protein
MSSQLYKVYTCDHCAISSSIPAKVEVHLGSVKRVTAALPDRWLSAFGDVNEHVHLCARCNPLSGASALQPPKNGPYR